MKQQLWSAMTGHRFLLVRAIELSGSAVPAASLARNPT